MSKPPTSCFAMRRPSGTKVFTAQRECGIVLVAAVYIATYAESYVAGRDIFLSSPSKQWPQSRPDFDALDERNLGARMPRLKRRGSED